MFRTLFYYSVFVLSVHTFAEEVKPLGQKAMKKSYQYLQAQMLQMSHTMGNQASSSDKKNIQYLGDQENIEEFYQSMTATLDSMIKKSGLGKQGATKLINEVKKNPEAFLRNLSSEDKNKFNHLMKQMKERQDKVKEHSP